MNELSSFLNFIYLLFPFLWSSAILIFLVCLKEKDGNATKCKLSLGLISFEREFQANVWFIRILLVPGLLIALSYPAFRDYSRFFPTSYKMDVFFDDEGITNALASFTRAEIKDLKIKENWSIDKTKYLSTLNKEIQKRVGSLFRFEGERGIVYSKAEIYFEVKKEKWLGLQRYHIQRAKGTLIHTFEAPGEKAQELRSEFELLQTNANIINIPIMDIYLRWAAILHPEFKQIFRLSPLEEIYHHSLVAITKIRFFPVIDISKTIYFIRDSNNQLVPIGYAIYNSNDFRI